VSGVEQLPPGRFSAGLWESTRELRGEIDRLPFLTALEDGTLAPEVFRHYLAQDAHYLASYSGVLAVASTLADREDEAQFWAASAASALAELELHAVHVRDFAAVPPSPACIAYTSYLESLAVAGYPELVAAVLPCFWIYEDVGRRLLERVGDLTGHRYSDWISTYGDETFAAATERARSVLDRVGADASVAVRERMLQAFTTASRHEWSFWDAAWSGAALP